MTGMGVSDDGGMVAGACLGPVNRTIDRLGVGRVSGTRLGRHLQHLPSGADRTVMDIGLDRGA